MDSEEDFQEFKKILDDESIPLGEAVKYLDTHFTYPRMQHFMHYQTAWIRKLHKTHMESKLRREVSNEEAVSHYLETRTAVAHRFYFDKYIVPVICDAERWKKISCEGREWVESQISNIEKLITEGKIDNTPYKPHFRHAA